MARYFILLLVFPLAVQSQSAERTMRKIQREMKRIERAELRANKRTTASFFPIITYTPETSLALGANVLLQRKPEKGDTLTNISFGNASLVYTLRNQFIIGFNNKIYFKQYNWYVTGTFSLSYFPYTFYGIGNESSIEEDYSSLQFSIHEKVLRTLVSEKHRLGLHYRFSIADINNFKYSSNNERISVSGSSGGITHQIGMVYRLDARDHSLAPTKGYFLELNSLWPVQALGDDFTFSQYEVDMRKYIGIGNQTIAVRSSVSLQQGEAPFYQLVSLADQSRMRGYLWGEFRDQNGWFNQLEWRIGFNNINLGLAFFTEWGAVGRSWDNLNNYWRGSFGTGIRYALDVENRMHFRFDAAYTIDNTIGFYVGLGEFF